MSGFWGWLYRAPLAAILYGGCTCHQKWCGRRTVGFSIWCRHHTDLILYDTFEKCRDRVDAGLMPWGG